MVLNHLAAILFFSGPVFYVGLWMVVDPAGIEWIAEFVVRVFRNLARNLGGRPAHDSDEQEHGAISRRLLRVAGVAMVLFAIVI
jgi:hypothetical protein